MGPRVLGRDDRSRAKPHLALRNDDLELAPFLQPKLPPDVGGECDPALSVDLDEGASQVSKDRADLPDCQSVT